MGIGDIISIELETRAMTEDEFIAMNAWLRDQALYFHKKRRAWKMFEEEQWKAEIEFTGRPDLAALFKLTWC